MGIRRYYLGCPIWSNRDWIGRFFSASGSLLRQYSAVFNTVEGNSTFYGLPRPEVAARWADEAAEGFRFCFKFPRVISHERRLRRARAETRGFLERMALVGDHLGPFFLQLPPDFGPQELPALADYLAALPADFHYAVEVRKPAFFTKGEAEQTLNRLLQERGIDRVILDSRALFSAEPDDEYTRQAQRRKPRLPVHAVAVGTRPLVRFIGHPQVEANRTFLEPWVGKLAEWIEAGKTPYLFAHTPDNRQAPELARLLHHMLKTRLAAADLGELPPWPAEPEGKQLGLL